MDRTCPSQALGGIARNGPWLTQQPSIEPPRHGISATMAYKFEDALHHVLASNGSHNGIIYFDHEILRFLLGTLPPQPPSSYCVSNPAAGRVFFCRGVGFF